MSAANFAQKGGAPKEKKPEKPKKGKGEQENEVIVEAKAPMASLAGGKQERKKYRWDIKDRSNIKEYVEHYIREQKTLKDEFDYAQLSAAGMTAEEAFKKRTEKDFSFAVPKRYMPSGESAGLRIRTPYQKLKYEFPTIYPRKYTPIPDHFRYERPPSALEDYLTKDAYFKDFVPPYKLESEAMTKCIEELKKVKTPDPIICKKMIELLSEMSLKDLSTLSLILSLEVPLATQTPFDDKTFWLKYEATVLEKYPQYHKELLWPMRYGFRKLKADSISPTLREKIYLRGVECLKCTSSVDEILHILKAFQSSPHRNMYNIARSTLIDRKDEFLRLDPVIKTPEFIANMIYTFGLCKPRRWGLQLDDAERDTKEFLTHYEGMILDNMDKMSPLDLVRLLLGFLGLKTDDYPHIYDLLEKRLMMVKDKLGINELTDVIWAFGHLNKGELWGREKTFEELEPLFMDKAESMNYWQVSRCAYTFAARAHKSEILFKYLDKRLHDELPNMKYASLQNVAYYLLMREHKDDRFWIDFAERTLAIPEVLPLIYYYPFKLCWQYLEGARPNWDSSALREKVWFADRMKVAIVDELKMYNNIEYREFMRFFSKFNLDPAIFYTFQNSFQVHLAFPEMKVGIMIYVNKDLVPGTMRVNQLKLIPGRILRGLGWQVLDISCREFTEMGYDPAYKYLKDWLELASDIQAEKGVIPHVSRTKFA